MYIIFLMTHIQQTVLFHTHWAAALIYPDAALLLLCVGGLESQEVLPCTQAIIVTQHTHYQVQRVSVQHILARGTFKSSLFLQLCRFFFFFISDCSTITRTSILQLQIDAEFIAILHMCNQWPLNVTYSVTLLTHWSSEATLTPYFDTPRIISLSPGTKGSFPSCCEAKRLLQPSFSLTV